LLRRIFLEFKAVDEDAGLVYFVGTKSGWLERHLYSVPLAGGEVKQITTEPGMHNVIIDHRRKTFVDQFSSASLPFRVHICSLADGSVIRDMYVNADPRLQRLQLNPPGTITHAQAQAQTQIHRHMCTNTFVCTVPCTHTHSCAGGESVFSSFPC
jgi:hypothetical protein